MGDLPLASYLSRALNALNVDTRFNATTIEKGEPKPLQNAVTIVAKPATRTIEWSSAGQTHNITYEQVGNMAIWIDTMAKAETMYTTFSDNFIIFQAFYPRETATIPYAGNTTQQAECLPCINCGILLPRKYIQMDHQRPQSGGGTEAIAKILRVLGCTMGPPKGEKCFQLHDAIGAQTAKGVYIGAAVVAVFNNGKGLKNPVTPKATRGQMPQPTHSLEERYTLNEVGMVFYSVVGALCGGAPSANRLETRAMHSVANIRPLCAFCNGSLGKKGVKFP